MTRQPGIARRVEELLGRPVVSTAPVAGGDIATATKVRLTDGTTAIVKTLPHPPAGFFAAEARGLAWLGEVDGGALVGEVLGAADDCVVLRWIEPARPSVDAANELGRRLAVTHGAVESAYGADQDGFIGSLPLPNGSAPTWAEFYATRRVLPYLKLARDRGHATPEHAAAIEGALGRLAEVVPEERPRRIHGDLWNGNVLWGADGCVLIDPAAHAGHRETDLAMLALFGVPHLQALLAAYAETAPLADGWEERVGLHQLHPLLVHACLFGGGYAARAAVAASSV